MPHHEELYPILAMYLLELVHIDFLMIDNPKNGKEVNVLVITNYFTTYTQAIVATLQQPRSQLGPHGMGSLPTTGFLLAYSVTKVTTLEHPHKRIM